ncbi:hypothetical protein NHF40_11405 [Maricaulaceae bacterium EIL42A08]|nr:hypothetical protein [Maricaulaceae bacterium EIL42A08]MCP2678987.1 hypothetical protein [Maricaulaceae bacterium NA33B04]
MPRRRSRILENRQARRSSPDGFDPSAAIRLAGFVAMVLVAIAVAAGFQGERLALVIAEAMSRFAPWVEPSFLGVSPIEWIIMALVALIAAFVVWRGFRRRR